MRRLACVFVLAAAGCAPPQATTPPADRGPMGIARLLGGSADRFARATEPRMLRFPQDHGAHPAFRDEWWYFTGNVSDSLGREYGFELTFFRIALTPAAPQRTSAWGANQVWMANFALTDAAGRRFFASERRARGALGLAGGTATPLRIWVEDWSAEGSADGRSLRVRLRAADADRSLDLDLESTGPPVPQGDGGLDAKGPEPGNASYYYSVPHLTVSGSLELEGRPIEVRGLAWFDREWSTSALSDGVAGWDWFALHLSDGRELMFYRLRSTGGAATRFSKGALIGADGTRTPLGADDVRLTATRYWMSPRTGTRYPVAWRLDVPRAGIALVITPYVEGQELDLTVRYWEGAVHAAGSIGARDGTALGYVELAGY